MLEQCGVNSGGNTSAARVVLREESGKDPVSQLAWANLRSRLQ